MIFHYEGAEHTTIFRPISKGVGGLFYEITG